MKASLCTLSLALCITAPAQIVSYSLSGLPGSGTAPVSASPTTVAPGLTATAITRGAGLHAALLANGFSADRWENPASAYSPGSPSLANALLRGDYFEFALTVQSGYSASLSTLDASLRRSAVNAAMNFEWQYSLDGFATAGVTIMPVGSIWTQQGWSQSTFTYLGRTSGAAPPTVNPYDWMIQDVPGRPNTTTSAGDPIPTIDLSGISVLQNISNGSTVTFRLYGWGNDLTLDSNTVALGRVTGPSIGGLVTVPEPSTWGLLGLGIAGIALMRSRRCRVTS